MQNVQTKEAVKQAAHRLHRKMKTLVPGTSLSQAQEALASVFGVRNFDSLMAAVPFEEDRVLPEEIGVRWAHFEDGVERDYDVIDSCKTEAAFKDDLLSFALRIERDLMGGTYKLFRARFSEEVGLWVHDEDQPVAVYEDCKLTGGSLSRWLAAARTQELKEIGVWGEAGTRDCSFTRYSKDHEVWLVGVYSATTIAGGFDRYIVRDGKTGKVIPLKDGDFTRYPDMFDLKEALLKSGYLPSKEA